LPETSILPSNKNYLVVGVFAGPVRRERNSRSFSVANCQRDALASTGVDKVV